MEEKQDDIVVPVISEELHADAEPVVTGGVRVTKRVHTHEEVLEQALRKSHTEVKRVATNRIVDGPQPARRAGDTLIIPIVSEVLRVEKQWVVTEEIHVVQTEEVETVQQRVPVSREEAQIERLDESGNAMTEIAPAVAEEESAADERVGRSGPASIVQRARTAAVGSSASRRNTRSLLDKRKPGGSR